MKRYLSDRQIGELLGNKSNVTIWRYRKAGILLPAIKLQGQNLTPEEKVYAAIDRLLGDGAAA